MTQKEQRARIRALCAEVGGGPMTTEELWAQVCQHEIVAPGAYTDAAGHRLCIAALREREPNGLPFAKGLRARDLDPSRFDW